MIALWQRLGTPAKARFALALLLSAFAGAFSVGLLGLSGWFLTASAAAGIAGVGLSFNHLFPSAGVRGLAFGRVLARYGEQLVGHDATLSASADLRPALFKSMAEASNGVRPLAAGELSSLLDDVSAAEASFLRVAAPAVGVFSGACVALGFAAALNLWVAIAGVVVFAIGGVGLPFLSSIRARRRAAELASAREALRADAANLVENLLELEILGSLERLSSALAQRAASVELQDAGIAGAWRPVAAFNAFAGCAFAFGILSLGGQPALAVGAALALIAAFEASGTMTKVMDAIPRAAASIERLTERFSRTGLMIDPPIAHAVSPQSLLPLRAIGLAAGAPDGPANAPIDLLIEPCSFTEISGPSGAGKTILMETLAHLRAPREGRVIYGGVDFARVRTAAVLAKCALAQQLPGFLPGTIKQALQLARPQATDEEILDALEVACLHDVIVQRSAVLETSISDFEASFSGGELRRLGIARALLAGPEMLLLDEPFAGLDLELSGQLATRLACWATRRNAAIVLVSHEFQALHWPGLSRQEIAVSSAMQLLD